MAYKFNPFTGKLDEVGAGGGGGSTNPGGSDTQIQFNDGGSFGGDADLTWNKTTNLLDINGDIQLDDGGASTTTIQCVTPTLDRTISFPDATGTVALVAGSNQAVQYNSAGTNAGDSGLLYDDTSGSLTVGGKTVTTDAPVINLSQTWDNASTTFTGLKLNVTNQASASTSNLLDLQVGGTSKFSVDNNGKLTIPGSSGPLSIIPSGNSVDFSVAGLPVAGVGLTYFGVTANADLRWTSSTTDPTAVSDLSLFRDAAGTLAQRNGTASQTFRLYNTLTGSDVSATGNYERGFLKWDSNVFKIGTEAGTGGGSARSLEIELNGSTRAIFGGSNSLTIPGAVSTVFIDCNTYFASTTAANSRALAGNGFAVGSAYTYGFSSTTGANGTQDVALARDSAGVVKVTNGSTGTGYIKQIPVAISALPDPTDATGVGAGTRGFVNDASSTTFAAQVAVGTNDGGSTVVPVYSDGSTWRIG